MKRTKLADAFISIALAELVGVLSSLLAGKIGAVYETLNKPPLSPPGWVFAVVWPILYALMGVAAYLVYAASAPRAQKKSALLCYTAQLFVNFTWSIVFFRFQLFWAAVAVIALLIALVALTIWKFYQIRRPAAYLLLPYLLWLLFAAYLTVAAALLNA